MEEPGRSRVRGLLSKALQFRNATVPRANMPLSIPFLSHEDFQINVERWLRNIIVNLKDMALPLFLPTRHLREAAYPKVREFLHNHRKAETWWDATDPEKLPCCCSFLRLHCTYDVDPQQHLAVNLEDLKLPKFLAVFSDANANSTYYLSRHLSWSEFSLSFNSGSDITAYLQVFRLHFNSSCMINGSFIFNLWIIIHD